MGQFSQWGDSSSVANELSSGVVELFSNYHAMAALKSDGSVVTWGNQYYGGDSSTVSQDIASDVISITSTDESFAALKLDGSVVSWGSYIDQSGVASELSSGVINVFSAYAVLLL